MQVTGRVNGSIVQCEADFHGDLPLRNFAVVDPPTRLDNFKPSCFAYRLGRPGNGVFDGFFQCCSGRTGQFDLSRILGPT